MANIVTENCVDGDLMIVYEMCKYLNYTSQKKQIIYELTSQGLIDVGTLVEEAMLAVGSFKRSTTGKGEDFDDHTDGKKAVVSLKDNSTRCRGATICNVKTKIGDLRIVIADPESKQLYYFFVPHEAYKGKINVKINFDMKGNKPMKSNKSSFSQKCWNLYRVESFIELCTKKPYTIPNTIKEYRSIIPSKIDQSVSFNIDNYLNQNSILNFTV